MATTSLTLYQIETELLELVQLRDEVASEIRVDAEHEAERQSELNAIDCQIAEYVKRELVKVDNVAGFLRECESRATVMQMEADRIYGKADSLRKWGKYVKQCAAEAMRLRLTPEIIERTTRGKFRTLEEATQGTKLMELRGKTSELKLCKNPVSLAEPQMDLLPADLTRITVTMTLAEWLRVTDAAHIIPEGSATMKREPMRAEIIARLKQTVPCENCGGTGHLMLPAGFTQPSDPQDPQCQACGGSGRVRATVPGARLIEDSVHVRIS